MAIRLKSRLILGITVIQTVLFLAHWFIYHTLVVFWWPLSPAATLALRTALFLLSLSFVAATLLGFYSKNRLATLFYRIAAIWLGLFNFFFCAACFCWLAGLMLSIFRLHFVVLQAARPLLAATFFGLAVVASLYGMVNARFIRIRRISIQLSGLPESWRGRTGLVLSDLHLGHVNGVGFSRRIVELAARLKPEIVFLPGDLFDGYKTDAEKLVAPFRALAPPFGSYFSTGNHDEFGNVAQYSEVLTHVGIRVLANEKVTVDGLDIAGLSDGDSNHPVRLRTTLEGLSLVPGRASILLNHVPNHLDQVEQAGISLQISGHTHGGQIFPFTWLTRRVFGKFTHGLQRYGTLQVVTSSGVGTWGPPMRVGTHPEIVLLTFE
jgi:predicted MPP superfamily phosphohydrolase